MSPSNIAWVGSLQAFLLLIVGVATGPIYVSRSDKSECMATDSEPGYGLFSTTNGGW